MKILIKVSTGINDCISILNRELRNCYEGGINYDSIYFYSTLYDLSEEFEISGINYISRGSEIDEGEYDRAIIVTGKQIGRAHV